MDDRISSLKAGQVLNTLTKLADDGLTGRVFQRLGQDEDFRAKVLTAIAQIDRSLDGCSTIDLISTPGESRMSIYTKISATCGRGWSLLKDDIIAGLSTDGSLPTSEPFDGSIRRVVLVPTWKEMSKQEVVYELSLLGLKAATADVAVLWIKYMRLQGYQRREIYVPGALINHLGDNCMLFIGDFSARLWRYEQIPRDKYIMAEHLEPTE